jgi:hypothetical protein
MEVSWIYLIGIAIVICATIGLVAGKLDAKDFIYIVGLVLSFLSGGVIGYKMRKKGE